VRRFDLVRHDDVSGVSGTGTVATGVTLPFGLGAFMRWRTPTWTLVYFPRVDWVEAIHGHQGRTRVVWRRAGRSDPQ
jgi:hypothetical protein